MARALISCVVAAGLMLDQAMAATTTCARPAEKAAFDVAGLKSELMVTALTCAAQDKYNSFIARFRPSLVAQERMLTLYFGRTYGHYAQSRHDDYVTSLANQESEEGTKLGADFCRQKVVWFDEVLALPDAKTLPDYAAGKTLTQPIAVVTCPIPVKLPRVLHASRSTHSSVKSAAKKSGVGKDASTSKTSVAALHS